jgi:hypothetical protein
MFISPPTALIMHLCDQMQECGASSSSASGSACFDIVPLLHRYDIHLSAQDSANRSNPEQADKPARMRRFRASHSALRVRVAMKLKKYMQAPSSDRFDFSQGKAFCFPLRITKSEHSVRQRPLMRLVTL